MLPRAPPAFFGLSRRHEKFDPDLPEVGHLDHSANPFGDATFGSAARTKPKLVTVLSGATTQAIPREVEHE